MVHGPITKTASARALGLIDIRVGASLANIASTSAVLTAAHSIGALKDSKFISTRAFFEQYSGFPKTLDGIIPLSVGAKIEGSYKEITPFNVALSNGLDPSGSVAQVVTHDVSLVSPLGTRDATKSITMIDATPADWANVTDEWTVLFTGATAGDIVGKNTGHVHAFTALDAVMAPVDGSSNKYFSIPASFFTGTWAAGDSYVFYTQAGGASTYAVAHTGSLGLGAMVAPADIRVEGVYTFPNGVNTLTYILPRVQVSGDLDMSYAEEDEIAPMISLNSLYAGSRIAAGHAVWDTMPSGIMVWA